ncbi:MAG TPA: dockerin type I domain-containing protein [Planctomycetota bacterium]|nr:dockerin type I domain-containing protein [Planctomycetota bacterium]
MGDLLEYKIYVRDLEEPVTVAQMLLGFDHTLASALYALPGSATPPWNDLVYHNWFEHESGLFGGIDAVVGVDRYGSSSTQDDGLVVTIYFLVTADQNYGVFQPWFRPRPGDPGEEMQTMLVGNNVIFPTLLVRPVSIYIDPVPPHSVQLAVAPSTCTNASLAELCVWAKDDEFGIARYEYRIQKNGTVTVPWTPLLSVAPPAKVHTACKDDVDISALTDGVYQVRLRAFDAAGNYTEAPGFEELRIDKTAPNGLVLTAEPATCTNADTIEITFCADDAGCGIAGFELFLDGGLVHTSAVCGTHYLDVSGVADGEHAVKMIVTDVAGNKAENTRPIWTDKTAPNDLVLIPDPATCTKADSIEITFCATDAGCGIIGFELFLDGGLVHTSAACGTHDLDVSGIADGDHAVKMFVTDVAGNKANKTITVTTDKTAPNDLVLIPDPATCTNTDSIEITFCATDAGCGIAGFELFLDGGSVHTSAVCGTHDLDVSGVADGDHAVKMVVTDVAGNKAEKTITVTTDKTAPNGLVLTADPATCTNTDSIEITFCATDAGCGIAGFELFLDGGSVHTSAVCGTHDLDVSGVADGDHAVKMVVTDVAGNKAEKTITVTTDKTAPNDLVLIPDPATCTNADTIEIAFCADDAGCGIAGFELFLDGGSVHTSAVCGTHDLDVSGIADGDHAVKMIVTDVAGNKAEKTITVTTVKTKPTLTIDSAQQAQDGGTVQLLAPSTSSARQGTVTIVVSAADAGCGLNGVGVPQLIVADSAGNPISVGSAVEGPAGTFTFEATIAAGTANGTATITATAVDTAGNSTVVLATFEVNKCRIEGKVTLQQLSAPSGGLVRTVTFVATDASANVLRTWNKALAFAFGSTTADYLLEDLPAGTAFLSAKTAWSLRRKLPASGCTSTVNFTGENVLLGGDINGDNKVDAIDYAILKANWFTSNSVADIDGSGYVNIGDYAIMRPNFFKIGVPLP